MEVVVDVDDTDIEQLLVIVESSSSISYVSIAILFTVILYIPPIITLTIRGHFNT